MNDVEVIADLLKTAIKLLVDSPNGVTVDTVLRGSDVEYQVFVSHGDVEKDHRQARTDRIFFPDDFSGNKHDKKDQDYAMYR